MVFTTTGNVFSPHLFSTARKQVDGSGKQRDEKRQKPARSHLTEVNWDAQQKRKCAIFRIFSDLYLLHNIKNALLCTGK